MSQPDGYTELRGARGRSVRRDAALKAHERRQGRRHWITATLGGIGVLAVIGATGSAASLYPAAPTELDTTARPAQLSAAIDQYVCPAVPRLPEGSEDGGDLEFSPLSTTASTTLTVGMLSDLAGQFPGSTVREATTLGDAEGGPTQGRDTGDELTASQPTDIQQGTPATAGSDGVPVTNGVLHLSDEPGGPTGLPSLVTVEPMGGAPALAAAATSYRATDGDLHGAVTQPCQPPAHQQWLTGANTTVGNTAILVITNPSASAATVDLTLYGANGTISSPGTTGLVLGPDQTRSFVLGGLAPNEPALAVQVNAAGGAVSTAIQQHRLFGIVPGGVDIIQPGSAPANEVVIAGVMVPDDAVSQQLEALAEEYNSQDAGVAVHLASNTDTTAEIQVVGPEGPVAGFSPVVVNLAAGATTSVPLEDLPAGVYSVVVEADAPVTATARGLAGNPEEASDISLVASATMLGFDQLTALSPHGTSQLVLHSQHGATVHISTMNEDGELTSPQERDLEGEHSVVIDLPEQARAVRVTTTDTGVHGGISVHDETGISGYPLTVLPTTAAGVPVRVGY